MEVWATIQEQSGQHVSNDEMPTTRVDVGKRRVVGREAPGVHTSCGEFTLR